MRSPPAPQPRSETAEWALLALAPLAWAGNVVVGEAAARIIPPMALAFLRWLTALVVLLPFALPAMLRAWPAVRRSWRLMLLFVVCGPGGFHALTYLALTRTTAINAALINSTIPVFVLLLGWAAYRTPIRPAAALGVAVSLAGVATVLVGGDFARLAAFAFNWGDLAMLTGIAGWSTYTIALRRAPPELTGLALIGWLALGSTLALAPLWAAELALVGGFTPSWEAAAAIVYVALAASIVGTWTWNRGMQTLGPARASPFIHLMPVFTFALSTIFLDQAPGWSHAAGLAAILAGVALAGRR